MTLKSNVSNIDTNSQTSRGGSTPIRKGMFSYYKPPIQNVVPCAVANLESVHKLMTGKALRAKTGEARHNYLHYRINKTKQSKLEYTKFKASQLPYVTFSGQFEKRHEGSILSKSGLMVLDFDNKKCNWRGLEQTPFSNPPNYWLLAEYLKKDTELDPQLIFVSPSGEGLKVVVKYDPTKADHKTYFQGFKGYFQKHYEPVLANAGIEIDNSGKDIARACFLCYDPHAYINPSQLQKDN